MYSYTIKVDKGIFEQQNDDRAMADFCIVTEGSISLKSDKRYIVAAVCDGVGGMDKGYLASMITLEEISRLNRYNISRNDIKAAIVNANTRVRALQALENMDKAMMSTVSGIYANEDETYIFNLGDSRVYKFRNRFITQISKDHSKLQGLIDAGIESVESARYRVDRNVITECVGYKENPNIQIVNLSGEFKKEDIIMICSDGISDVLSNDCIEKMIFKHKNDEELESLADEIIKRAVENGSRDNMSVILLRKEYE